MKLLSWHRLPMSDGTDIRRIQEGNDKHERDENATGPQHSELGAQSYRSGSPAADTILQIYRRTGVGLHLYEGRRGALGPHRVGSAEIPFQKQQVQNKSETEAHRKFHPA